jgi:phage protein D
MSQFNPHARVEIFEEQTTGGKKEESGNQVWDSWIDVSLISAVHIELVTNEASQLEFTVFDQSYKFLDQYSRAGGVPWAVARVWLGFGNDLGEPLFKGLLASAEHNGGNSTLSFYDMAFKMRQQQKTEYHKGLDLDVMRKLVERNGLKWQWPGAGVKGLPLKSRKQEGQTDWELLLSLAGEAGLVIYVRGDTVFAQRPARTSEPVLSLGRRDLRVLDDTGVRYKVPENLEGRPRRVEHRGRGRAGRRMTGTSDASTRGREQLVIKQSVKHGDKTEAQRRAQAKKELEREHAFEGRVSSILQTNIRADVRQTVELVDHGLLLSGKYLVDSVSHAFEPGHLSTDYDLYRDFED